MKWFKAYTSFTRTERMGIVALLSIILILITIKATMHLWVSPKTDAAKQEQLSKKWEAFKQHAQTKVLNQATEQIAPSATLFSFDPNTIDAAGLKKLGLQEKTISIFLNWRNKGKHFYNKEDFKELYTLSAQDYSRLAPYINIHQQKINLNTADSATLVSLPGIGAKLAHKILEYKKEIGKYRNIQQLMDVYHFSDSTMKTLQQRLIIN
jgi:DNA uptake protein ComE-like DNA-binding protein